MLNLLASLTTPKKEASQPVTTVKIQITPGMADEEILQQVRSMAIMNAGEDEPPSTPSEGGEVEVTLEPSTKVLIMS